MLLAATFIYFYTCTGTIVKVEAKFGKAVGHWEASKLLPKELAIDVRDGCLLNNLQYDAHGKKLLAIVPADATVDASGKRNHRLVAFDLLSMHFAGSLVLPPTAAVPEIAPEGRVHFDMSDEQYESVVDASKELQWVGGSRKRPAEAAVLDPAHQMAAKLSQGQHLSRLSLDGKHILVESKGGKLAVYSALTGKQTTEGKWPDKGRFICLAPGGRLAFYNVDSRLQVIQLPGGTAKPVAADVEIDRSATCVAAPQ